MSLTIPSGPAPPLQKPGLVLAGPWFVFALATAGLAAGAPGVPDESGMPVMAAVREANGREKEDAERAREYPLKAAFLHHFFKYTTWPKPKGDEKPGPFKLLVVGGDPFGDILEKTFKDKQLQGRSVQVVREAEVDPDLEADMVFAGGLDEDQRTELLAICKGRPILLVGQEPGFALVGANCNFYLEDGHVRFEINTEAVKESKLTISSELLKLARLVKPKEKKS